MSICGFMHLFLFYVVGPLIVNDKQVKTVVKRCIHPLNTYITYL